MVGKSQPDNECNQQFYDNEKKTVFPSEVCGNPSHLKCGDEVNGASNSHVKYKLQEKRKLFIVVDF